MQLLDVYEPGRKTASVDLLYLLLSERKPHQSISHKAMPPWDAHCAFVDSHPYRHWYIVVVNSVRVGAVYISKTNEVGVGILSKHQRNGYAREALQLLMTTHPGPLLANINPANHASIQLFTGLGFTGPIQVTYEYK